MSGIFYILSWNYLVDEKGYIGVLNNEKYFCFRAMGQRKRRIIKILIAITFADEVLFLGITSNGGVHM